jgi:hypothetical protein
MKKLLIICWLIIGSSGLLLAQNTLYLSLQPTDLGVGIRYDHQIGDNALYGSISHGNYKYNGGYIDNHWKIALGGVLKSREFYEQSFITWGLNFHHYGKHILTEEVTSRVFNPISMEFGAGVKFKRIAVAFRMDIFKWESNIDIGFNF